MDNNTTTTNITKTTTTGGTSVYTLSNQALGAVMMALQESLLNELDIVPILKGFKMTDSTDGLIVTNPPTVRVSTNETVTNDDLVNIIK
tara:strand:- start:1786 stop:2052 length:267 start_codon:yes stop_codon:yes gene_type:complete